MLASGSDLTASIYPFCHGPLDSLCYAATYPMPAHDGSRKGTLMKLKLHTEAFCYTDIGIFGK